MDLPKKGTMMLLTFLSSSFASKAEAVALVSGVLWVCVACSCVPVMVCVGCVLHQKACFQPAACCPC